LRNEDKPRLFCRACATALASTSSTNVDNNNVNDNNDTTDEQPEKQQQQHDIIGGNTPLSLRELELVALIGHDTTHNDDIDDDGDESEHADVLVDPTKVQLVCVYFTQNQHIRSHM
jgi:hypothetical protein